MIKDYLLQFHKQPKDIEEFKINTLKNYYYNEINKILPIKRENFQIGVNNNFNILFFRDKTNKHNELILNIHTNYSQFNYRKQISYSFNMVKSEVSIDPNLKKNINDSLIYFNKTQNKRCNISRCNISRCNIL